MSGLGTAVSGALGIGTAIAEGNVQQHFNQQNTDMQMQAQQQMVDYNQASALDMWNKTNYGAQRKHMEDAGLNVGLMYGKGGGGATATTGSPAGQVSAQNTKIDTAKGMGAMLQAEALQSQIKLNESQANKNTAETEEVKERTPTYQKGMEKTDQEIKEMASRMGVNDETMKKIIQEVEQSKSTVKVQETTIPKIQAETEKVGAETTRIQTITPIEKDLIKENLKSQITRNVYLDRKERAELDNLVQDVANKKAQILQGGQKLDIEKFTNEMKADYPSLFDTAGHLMDSSIRMVMGLLGQDEEIVKRKVNLRK